MNEHLIYPLGSVSPSKTRTELSCSTVIPVLRCLEHKIGRQKMERLVFDTGMNLEYLSASENWISYDYFCELQQKAIELTGDDNFPFEAGQLHTDMTSYGSIANFIMHFGTPALTYVMIARFSNLWSRISHSQILSIDRGLCVMKTSYPRHKQGKINCLAVRGSLSAIPRLWGLPYATILDVQCAADGADSCVYRISWTDRPTRFRGPLGFVTGLAMAAVACRLAEWVPWEYSIALILSLLGYVLGREFEFRSGMNEANRRNDEQATSLLEAISSSAKLNMELQQRVEQRTAELSTANRNLTQALADLQESENLKLVAEKQAAIGILAGGMAHEINNPLNAIRLSTQALAEDIEVDSPLRPQIDLVVRATGRCRRIIDEMLALSRDPRQELNVSIEEIVRKSVGLFTAEHDAGIRIRVDVAPDLPRMQLDRMQIQQIVMNLLKNASDAMAGKGNIDVSLAREGGNIALKVADHGCGIEKADCTRIFDPFFTTKGPNKGMGLGLSISYQLVKRNGGSIDVTSEKGKGTAFTARFPVGPVSG